LNFDLDLKQKKLRQSRGNDGKFMAKDMDDYDEAAIIPQPMNQRRRNNNANQVSFVDQLDQNVRAYKKPQPKKSANSLLINKRFGSTKDYEGADIIMDSK
jgi:hypothetical protein